MPELFSSSFLSDRIVARGEKRPVQTAEVALNVILMLLGLVAAVEEEEEEDEVVVVVVVELMVVWLVGGGGTDTELECSLVSIGWAVVVLYLVGVSKPASVGQGRYDEGVHRKVVKRVLG